MSQNDCKMQLFRLFFTFDKDAQNQLLAKTKQVILALMVLSCLFWTSSKKVCAGLLMTELECRELTHDA